MSVISCTCEKPAPKHELGVFCRVCNGFIEENNKARTVKIIGDKAKSHPWFEKKTPSFEGKTTTGTGIAVSIPKFEHSDKIHRFMSDADIKVLEEHRDIMEDVRTGDYKPDSFTNQPIQILIDRLLNK